MLKVFKFVIVLFSSISLFAQNGSINGKVIDAISKEDIIGANVYIDGTTVGASTSFDGTFLINNIKPGTYTVVVSFVTYKTQAIENVVVESAKRTTLNIQLVEDVAELAEVVVTATREINNDVALLSAIKESKLVVSGISAEQIVRIPDNNAAEVMTRVPGVSIIDNRFVMIRGVSDRYNQVMINNMIGPSTEVDRRTFSFDLIPSGTIDQLLIMKSGSYDLPADFSGGIIQVLTKSGADENYLKFGTSVGVRLGTTFRPYRQSQGSSTDWLGFDNGFRSLPEFFPTTEQLQNSGRTSTIREQAGRTLTNNFDYDTRNAPIDFGYNMELSRFGRIGRVKVNTLNNVSYSNSYLYKNVEFNRYLFNAESIETRFNYNDSYHENDVRVSALSNWNFAIGNNHNIEFKNIANLIGENQTILRDGIDNFINVDRTYNNYSYYYLSRFIYSGQLQGKHNFMNNSLVVDWVAGHNNINRDEPDFRRFRTFTVRNTGEDGFQVQLPPSANLFETGRFYSELQEVTYTGGLNIEKKFGDPFQKRIPSIKTGIYYEQKDRDFNARYVSYLYPGFFDPAVGENLIRLPIGEVFAPENIKASDGFVIEEGTRPSDSYTGSNRLLAGYVGGFLPLNKFDISAGLRVENNIQRLNTATTSGPIGIYNPVLTVHPFFNSAYNLNDTDQLRVTYSRTVNRPEFRELAPFVYYDFELEQGVQGNPNLQVAMINNFDIRWEKYPNPGELISFGLFYKNFKNPIESILIITTEQPQNTFGNAPFANNYGAEIEYRKSLASFGVSRFLQNMTVNFNASYIFSEVDLGAQAGAQQRVRQLQGQSPYLINVGLFYTEERTGLTVSAAYNRFGPRIFAVGDIIFPSIFELPRDVVDMQIAKRFGQFEAKLNLKNLLNAQYRFYQDTNVDNKIEIGGAGNDAPILEYRVGQQISVSMSYRFSK